MIDIRQLDRAITQSLKQNLGNGGRYACVIWGPPGTDMAYVTSNVIEARTVAAMFENAIDIVGSGDGMLINATVEGNA